MKLSEVRGERTMDVLSAVIEPIITLAQHDESKKLVEMIRRGEKGTSSQTNRALHAMIKDCGRELVEMLSVIDGVTADEYKENTTMPSLFSAIVELFNDSVFIQLFTSAQSTTDDGSPDSAQENTQDGAPEASAATA